MTPASADSVRETLRALVCEIDDRVEAVQADGNSCARLYAATGKRKHRVGFEKSEARRGVLMDLRDVVKTRLRLVEAGNGTAPTTEAP